MYYCVYLIDLFSPTHLNATHISDVIVIVLASSGVDHESGPS